VLYSRKAAAAQRRAEEKWQKRDVRVNRFINDTLQQQQRASAFLSGEAAARAAVRDAAAQRHVSDAFMQHASSPMRTKLKSKSQTKAHSETQAEFKSESEWTAKNGNGGVAAAADDEADAASSSSAASSSAASSRRNNRFEPDFQFVGFDDDDDDMNDKRRGDDADGGGGDGNLFDPSPRALALLDDSYMRNKFGEVTFDDDDFDDDAAATDGVGDFSFFASEAMTPPPASPVLSPTGSGNDDDEDGMIAFPGF
jgi:hypothetical protein